MDKRKFNGAPELEAHQTGQLIWGLFRSARRAKDGYAAGDNSGQRENKLTRTVKICVKAGIPLSLIAYVISLS